VGHVLRRLVAFDLDGTLVDSRQDLADSANELIAECGGRPLLTEEVEAMVGEGAGVLVRRALLAAGLPESATALSRFLSIYDERLVNNTRLYPGIGELLSAARSFASVAVLTNKPLRPSERILEALGVRDLVSHIIGGDGPYPRKPDPSGLLALMQAVGAGGDSTLLVGDSQIDRDTAERAGAFCCVVTYGFGRAELPAGPREWVVSDTAEVGSLLRRFADAPVSGPLRHVDEQL
jgi:phosphoglycolate phosphatase